MIPELEKPKITEIKVRMDCNGCVQKIKKALYGINGIYDIYIDFSQQKLTIIGWADPERIMKAIKKTRKIATLCSNSEQTDPQAAAPPDGQGPPPDCQGPAPDGQGPPPGGQGPPPEGQGPPPGSQGPSPSAYNPSMEAPSSHNVAVVAGPEVHSHTEVAPSHVIVHDAHSGPRYDPTNATGQQATQPPGSHEPGQVHVTHHQPPDQGHIVHHHSSEPGHVVHQGTGHGYVDHHQPPMHDHVVHHHQPEDSHVVHHHQPADHSQVVHYQPPYSHGHVVHHKSENSHGHTSGYNYHHNIPGTIHTPESTPPVTVVHSYNTYKPSPYVTEYIRPMTSHRPSPYTYEYMPQQPTTNYSPRMDHYNEDYYNTGTSSNNGNITSIFSDENPNACNLM